MLQNLAIEILVVGTRYSVGKDAEHSDGNVIFPGEAFAGKKVKYRLEGLRIITEYYYARF
jgi:hypothetical protein